MLGSILGSLIFRRGSQEVVAEPAATPISVPLALSELEQLDRAGCLIRVDYPYHPRKRTWDESTNLYKLVNAGRDEYLALLREFAAFAPFFERIAVSGGDATD